jgi:hypothetical protein
MAVQDSAASDVSERRTLRPPSGRPAGINQDQPGGSLLNRARDIGDNAGLETPRQQELHPETVKINILLGELHTQVIKASRKLFRGFCRLRL